MDPLDPEVAARLDNAMWHALLGPQAHLGRRAGRAARYRPEFGIFAGVEAEDEGAMADLASLLGADESIAIRRHDPDAPLPGPLETRRVFPALQMVAPLLDGVEHPDGLTTLGPADVDDMLELTRRTQPGPFFARTHELGTYLGVRAPDGTLVAMAGERLRIDGASEISAVCVHPDHRRRGLGAALTLAVAGHVQQRGERSFLHVRAENREARALYERLGFHTRLRLGVVEVGHRRGDESIARSGSAR